MSSWVRVLLSVGFSVATTLVAMALMSRLPGLEIPTAYWWFGVLCPALISAPVSILLVRQAEANRRLNEALVRAYGEVKRLSEIDQMTGLYNRAAFLAHANQLQSDSAGALLVIDIDHFKSINDVHGHDAGDKALAAIALALSAGIRPGDVAGRMGGEEFAVYLAGADAETALAMAERLRTAIAGVALSGLRGQPLTVTASIGVTDGKGRSIADSIRTADLAMYRAKRDGRNRVAAAA